MLSAKAHSIGRQAFLAISLSWIGGFTNVITVLACHALTSHMTGNTTNATLSLLGDKPSDARHFAVLVCAFFAGALLSSAMLEAATLFGVKSKYVFPLFVEAILLALLMFNPKLRMGVDANNVGLFIPALAALAMGLQNATISQISGNVVRTTHVTGVLTDIGIVGAQYLFWHARRERKAGSSAFAHVVKISFERPDVQRLLVLISIFVSFSVGAVIAVLLFPHWGSWAFACPIVFLLAIILTDWIRPIAEIKTLDLAEDPVIRRHELHESMFPPEVAVVQIAHDDDTKMHRAPDFDFCVNAIPPEKSTVILIFSPRTILDANAIRGLEKVVTEYRRTRKTLILAGITIEHYAILKEFKFQDKVGREAIHPDLEFALAYAATIGPPAKRKI